MNYLFLNRHRLVQKLQQLFYTPMLCSILVFSTVIIFCVYEVTVIKSMVSVYFAARVQIVFCALLEILMFAVPCEKINIESQKIRQILYCSSRLGNINVAKLNKRKLKEFQSILFFAAMKADKTISISAGGFFKLTFPAYMDVSLKIIFLMKLF
jgi:hypothetical protein